MKGYLKMSDVFSGKARLDFDGKLSDDKVYHGTLDDFDDASIDATIHAINSHDGLVAEVERLRKAVELASMTLDEVDLVLTERIKNGAYDLDDISAEVEGAIKRLSETE